MVKLLIFLNTVLLGIILISIWVIFVNLKNFLAKETQMNQKRIDDLTKQLNEGNEGVVEVVRSESAEVQKAIEDSSIDTTELEKAIAANAQLKDLVSGIYTPNKVEETGGVPPSTGTETGSESGNAGTGASSGGELSPGSTETAGTSENKSE